MRVGVVDADIAYDVCLLHASNNVLPPAHEIFIALATYV